MSDTPQSPANHRRHHRRHRRRAKGQPFLRPHLYHHNRFYAALVGGAVAYVLARQFDPAIALVIAGDIFFATYLLSAFLASSRIETDDLRRRAEYDDEGIVIIVVLTIVAVALSFGSIFALLHSGAKPSLPRLLISLIAVPLGWMVLHTVAAFHYAHLYYAPVGTEAEPADAKGLAFPGTEEPVLSDFVYYSFVVGMTAQVSDVQVEASDLRRLTVAHGMVSFLFNTVLLALAVNIAASLAT